jgi:hypothetical protein
MFELFDPLRAADVGRCISEMREGCAEDRVRVL